MVSQLPEYSSGRIAERTITFLEHLDDMKNFSLHGVMEDSWDTM
jgi:hypothetical protein